MAFATGHTEPGLLARRLGLAAGWFLVALIVHLSLTPEPIQLPVQGGDKHSHALAYFTLMSCFSALYVRGASRIACAVCCVALGVALEYAQLWSGVRSFEYADMLAGAAGVMAAWLVAPPRLPNLLVVVESAFRRHSRPRA